MVNKKVNVVCSFRSENCSVIIVAIFSCAARYPSPSGIIAELSLGKVLRQSCVH